MRTLDAIWLVAWREISTRMRSHAYRISTVLVSLAVVGLIAGPQLLGDDGPSTVTIAVVDGTQPAAFELGTQGVGAQLDLEVEVREVAAEAVRSAVTDGDADVGVVGDEAVWNERVDDLEAAVVRGGLQAAAADQRREELGLRADQAAQLLAPVELTTSTIEPEDADRGEKVATAMVGVILLFMAIQFHGAAVLQGVIEEKSSRVVEILLTHIRASQLLAGKIAGIGIVGLSQAAVVAVVGLASSAVINGADVPQLDAVLVLSSLGWFVLGFVLYATAFATAGSLVSRQEDAQAATAPLAIPFLAAYILSIGIADDPDQLVGRIASMFPLTAPLSMPVRIAAGSPAALEIVIAVGLTVAAIAGLIHLGGRIYRRNLLRTGARVPWTQALRGLRSPTALD